jgi:hypothetical protein
VSLFIVGRNTELQKQEGTNSYSGHRIIIGIMAFRLDRVSFVLIPPPPKLMHYLNLKWALFKQHSIVEI